MIEAVVYSQEDESLMKQLLEHGLSPKDIIEKFETTAYDFSMCFLDVDFKVHRRLFDLRLSKGSMILGEDSVEKKCGKCGDYHPFTSEFWYSHKASADGSWHICVACEKERATAKRKTKSNPYGAM